MPDHTFKCRFSILRVPGRPNRVRCEFYSLWTDSDGKRCTDSIGCVTVFSGPAFRALEAAMPGVEFTGRFDEDLLSLSRNEEVSRG